MSKLFRILTTRSKVLSTVAHEEIKFPLSSRVEDLFDKTIDTLRYQDGVYAKRGLAISANQIGSLKRFFVICDPNVQPLGKKVYVICNPEIVDVSTEGEDATEGCLSIPKWHCLVNRPKQCVVKYQDINGNYIKAEHSNLVARIFQHEIDHLNGITIFNKQKEIIKNPLYDDYLKRKRQERLLKKKVLKNEDLSKIEANPEDF